MNYKIKKKKKKISLLLKKKEIKCFIKQRGQLIK